MISGTTRRNDYFVRFSVLRRAEHHVNAVAFIVLIVTGVAQKFYDAGWAEWVILRLGGIDSTRLVHRYTGAFFTVLILQHIIVAFSGILFRGWRPTMIINRNDFRDAFVTLKYYFGIVDRPARCDRYDYRQKFEYWGVILGGLVMIVTGFILWFPATVFQLLPFFPGHLIPAAKEAHTNEAMLALIVIAIWHIYNSVFSPEVFPLDTSIFTGKISKARMIHEHPLEYERLTGIKGTDTDAEKLLTQGPAEVRGGGG